MSTQNTNVTANTELFKEDGSISNDFANPNDSSQFATSPNTTTEASKSNTGSGLQAPEVNKYDSSGNLVLNDAGKPVTEKLQYSWESKADERANLDYQSNILETKANMLENRQQLESQGQQLQDQAAMEQYNRNQSAEKVGWTGGYILDSERQMNYLKQSIQSQMYGQMELQKYGYDTSLAAARLAYDTNRYDLALEYYNTALSRAVTEAEITGYYVSPEASEMLDQYHIASKALNENPEDAQAQSVLKAIYDWFEGHGISKNGVETYSHLVEERTHKMAIDQLYEYQNAAQNQININEFVKLDGNGNKIYTDTGVEIVNFDKMSTDELFAYTKTSKAARDQYYSRLDTIVYDIETSFTNTCITNGHIDTDEKGNITNVNKENFSEILRNYLATDGTNLLQKELDKFEDANPEEVNELLSNWSCDIKLPDGSTVPLSLIPATKTDTGITIGDITVNKDGTTKFNYEGYYVKGENNTTYIKDCKNLNTLTAVIQNNPEMAKVLELLELDPRSESYSNAISDWINGLQAVATVGVGAVGAVAGGVVGSLAGPVGTIVGAAAIGAIGAVVGDVAGAAVAGVWDIIDDLFVQPATSQHYKQQVDFLSSTISSIENYIGESNMAILREASDKYNSLSDRDKALLTDSEKEQLKYANSLVSSLDNYKQALSYAEARDSNIWQDPWEYIGDNWVADMTDIWDDGYQFGDVAQTVVTGVVDVAETAVAAVVGGVQWLWNSSAGNWFGWHW